MAVALAALFVALGGTGYALTTLDKGSVTTREVKNRSLLKKDFKRGQVPRGAQGEVGPQGPIGETGPQGETGEKGDTGATGTVDTSDFFTKSQSDARFLPIGGTAADADQLGGIGPGGFVQGTGLAFNDASGVAQNATNVTIATIPFLGTFRGSCNGTATSATYDFQAVDNAGANVFSENSGSKAWNTFGVGGDSPDITSAGIDHTEYLVSNGEVVASVELWVRAAGGSNCTFHVFVVSHRA